MDFSKAFDTVNHEILLAKLKLLGIKNNNFSWLENYLTDRKQCTLVAGTTSEFMKITCGVPQGSILGPLLFLLYVNDMPDVVKDSSIYLYADDTVLLNYGKNMINVKKRYAAGLRENCILVWTKQTIFEYQEDKKHAIWV